LSQPADASFFRVLDHFKFTDGLVGHSLLAMAGFVSSLLIFVMVQLLGEDGWIFDGSWSFYVWQGSVLTYVMLMFFAGWREGSDPAFTMVPGTARNSIYILRLLVGVLMLIASGDWLLDASRLLREPASRRISGPKKRKPRLLFSYQMLTGVSDTSTGVLLIFAPGLTLRLMRLHVSPDSLPFLSYIGAFVLSVGIACLYGAYLATRAGSAPKLEVVWLLTGITRGLVAMFVVTKILTGTLEAGWISVAVCDGAFALLQAIGLSKGWLGDTAV
jgi:hypothetical protein